MRTHVVVSMLVVLIGGCYRPSFKACELACAGGVNGDCPDGLTCSAEGYCAASANQSCQGAIDDADITPDGDDGGPAPGVVFDPDPLSTSCGWPQFSNIDPCNVGADLAANDFIVTTGFEIDTDKPSFTVNGVNVGVQAILQRDGTPAALVVLRTVTFDPGSTAMIVVRGSRPLILTSSAPLEIPAGVRFIANNQRTTRCASQVDGPMVVVNDGGGGGAGGSFAYAGGQGGRGTGSNASSGGAPGMAGPVVGTVHNVPLQAGCAGGLGGFLDTVDPSYRGLGGGAIQISGKSRIKIAGAIVASGTAGFAALQGTADGGAGGGSGGAILVEAPNVDLEGALLCATGGGGGAGGDLIEGSNTGDVGRCDGIAAAGGTGPAGVGAGGYGGAVDEPMSGGNAVGTTRGGGGGGGSSGRIRLNGTISTTGAPIKSYPKFTHD